MKPADRKLGMGANISRRDFLNGVSVAIGASLLPPGLCAGEPEGHAVAGYYPPALSGMRGSHPGSFGVAHALRDGKTWPSTDSDKSCDLVVVGGGISGLSAAYFYRQAHGSDARVLILENHDDFGGHAKRNEFEVGGRPLIGYGGTMLLEEPGAMRSSAVLCPLGV